MTDTKQVMQQALEALRLPCDRWNGQQTKMVNAAIEALSAALAAPAAEPQATPIPCAVHVAGRTFEAGTPFCDVIEHVESTRLRGGVPEDMAWQKARECVAQMDALNHETISAIPWPTSASFALEKREYARRVEAAVRGQLTVCIAQSLNAAPQAPALDAVVVRNVSQAARDVLAERQRQISVEQYESEADDEYDSAELAYAAAAYAITPATVPPLDLWAGLWPWPVEAFKPSNRRRNMVKAGALILAEIERLDRAAMSAQGGGK